jgi:tRNA (guanine-N(7)-)-methyltransferase
MNHLVLPREPSHTRKTSLRWFFSYNICYTLSMNLRKLFYTHILKKQIPTVQLRGRVSPTGAALLGKYQGTTILSVQAAVKRIQKTDTQVLLEIGFGNGAHIVSLAQDRPDTVVIGCELYLDGVVRTLEKVIEKKLNNIFLVSEDARKLIAKIPQKSLSECYVLFPDPWPKARHHKRRICTKEFCDDVVELVVRGGSFIVATDWAGYGEDIEHIIQTLVLEKKVSIKEIDEHSKKRILSSTFALRAHKEGRDVYIRRIERIH